MDLYQDWRHDTCHGCARCVSSGDPALYTADGWLVWLGWTTQRMPLVDFDVWGLLAPDRVGAGVAR
jgi:hypothetical protein